MAGNSEVLPWKTRWKIGVGAARGLRYLHEESRVRSVVQRNSITRRPNSADSMPRVGLSMGTSCFLAPEYAESGSMTDKSDVFTFGVMLLELITGRKAVDTTRTRGPMTLMEWAQPLLQAGNTAELVDPCLNNVYDAHQLNKMIDAARRCTNVAQLPTMSEVLQILERKLQTLATTAVQPRVQLVPNEDWRLTPVFARSSLSPAWPRRNFQTHGRTVLSYDTML